MVVALGPGKFYGSSLPRPRFYSDLKYNSERVDPPVPVLDPLMSWAEEAHWTMGGLNVKRLRFQGRIEGNMDKIRSEHERSVKKKEKEISIEQIEAKLSKGAKLSPSPPPAPFMVKRRRRFLVDEDENEGEGEERESVKRGTARKLYDDFDKVAVECGMKKEVSGSEGVSTRSRSARSGDVEVELKGKKKLKLKNNERAVRVSPRLAKRA